MAWCALAVALGALLLLAARQLPVTRLTFTLDQPPPQVLLRGFYAREQSAAGAYRWSRPEAYITIPVDAPAEYRITLALQDSPAAQPPRPVTVSVNDVAVGTVRLDPGLREYAFHYRLDPRAWAAGWQLALHVKLQTTPFVPASDTRILGVVVTQLAVEPVLTPPSWRWRAALLVPNLLLLLAVYAALRLQGLSVTETTGGLAALLGAYALYLIRIGAPGDTLSFAYAPVNHPQVLLGTLLCLAVVLVVAYAPTLRLRFPDGLDPRSATIVDRPADGRPVPPSDPVVALPPRSRASRRGGRAGRPWRHRASLEGLGAALWLFVVLYVLLLRFAAMALS